MISPDARWPSPASPPTHHEVNGRPAYAARFDAVLKFHEPGLAAVRSSGRAWHVDVHGAAAYPDRFRQTFGYYEGLAAIEDDDGWTHIDAAGKACYAWRFDWCGNFQQRRCATRDRDSRYRHITAQGKPLQPSSWRYVGDFRDGSAVVHADTGLATHIDLTGRFIHGRWFVDLDVFHKGCARARDDRGWFHIDAFGGPLYVRRFAAVEPFYNGQARVECPDGRIEVIDPSGKTRAQITQNPR